MPAVARLNDAVYTDDPDDGRIYGAIMVGSPNVFVNEGGASTIRVAIPPAVALAQNDFIQDYVANPQKYADPNEEQVKPNYPGTLETSGYKTDPSKTTTAASTPTPNLSGNKCCFVGGNQNTKAIMRDPTGGGVTISYSSGNYPASNIVSVARLTNGAAVLPFLAQCANKVEWVETGMGGKPSNQKITNIWRELGFPQSGCWLTDQTPWCAGFVQYALKQSGLPWMPEAGARNTLSNISKIGGTCISVGDMQPGDIVLWRTAHGNHVNFCYNRWS